MKIWHIRKNKRMDYIIVDNKLVLDEKGTPKRHKSEIIGTLVLCGENIGGAVCCPEDNFSKALGVKIALGRAKNGKSQIPSRLLGHAKRMAKKYNVTLPVKSTKPLEKIGKIGQIDWDVLEEGTLIKPGKYEDFRNVCEDFSLCKAAFDEVVAESPIKFKRLLVENGVFYVVDWEVPLEVFSLVE